MAAGKERKVRRIQEVLDVHELNFKDIQRKLHFKSYATAYETIHGRKNNRKVLNYLLDLGVPASVLDLPHGFVRVRDVHLQQQEQEAV